MKLTRAYASIACTRGIQTPLNSPYSTVIAWMSMSIGKISGFTSVGISSRSFLSLESICSLATRQMSICVDRRYTARTNWPVPTSNQKEPTIRFHRGSRAVILSSRNRIRRSGDSAIVIESPVS